MVLTIDQLQARITSLEMHIQLLSSNFTVNHKHKHKPQPKHKPKHNSGFKAFAKAVRPHVRSYLFNNANSHFIPKNTDINIEISAMWNEISPEEKLHWTYTYTIPHE